MKEKLIQQIERILIMKKTFQNHTADTYVHMYVMYKQQAHLTDVQKQKLILLNINIIGSHLDMTSNMLYLFIFIFLFRYKKCYTNNRKKNKLKNIQKLYKMNIKNKCKVNK